MAGHPITNKNVLSDEEIDQLYRQCHKPNQDKEVDPKLGIFIPFDLTQLDLLKLKLQTWLEPIFRPCDSRNLTNNPPEIFKTDIIFFFIGDDHKHPNIKKELEASINPRKLHAKSKKYPVRKCFSQVHFKSLRQLDLPLSITIRDLFYGVIPSKLVSGYTHIIWMDATISPIHPNWLARLYHTLHSEPFWILGSMTSSQRHDHFDRSHYHMHMNAIYRIGNACFNQFLLRVKHEYRNTMPDLAIHMYRTDYANFREAQHTQHLFRYSNLFIALDLPLTVRPNINIKDWPETFFLIQDKHWARGGKKVILAKDKNTIIETDAGVGEEELKEVPVIKNEIKDEDLEKEKQEKEQKEKERLEKEQKEREMKEQQQEEKEHEAIKEGKEVEKSMKENEQKERLETIENIKEKENEEKERLENIKENENEDNNPIEERHQIPDQPNDNQNPILNDPNLNNVPNEPHNDNPN